ncbi:xylulokinase [Pseudoramibacter faecis]|uniref:xylulokinase n=1 Tax=Pseudoramibacter faecis TaxID=3108534 RepID=UPI002E771AEF|nr:FGGY family carbohydrate kinase [Pseudoramibacter sp. HA2172]
MNEYVLAYDCGTTSVKTVVISDKSKVICDARADYALTQLHPGWAEQDPEELWQAICRTTKEALLKADISAEQVIGMVFAAPWKNIIPIDKDGNVLRESIIWMDARATDQAERLNQKLGFFVGTGQEYWPRLMWVKENEPEIWKKSKYIFGLNTYFKWRATGKIVTEPSDDFIHSSNVELQKKYETILEGAGLDEDLDKFPQSFPATQKVGETTYQSANELGLVPGIPVFGGFGDLPAITVGTGCCQKGMMHIYFGTSSWLVEMKTKRYENYSPQWFTFDENMEGAMFSLQTGCLAFDWAVEQFYHAERQLLGTKIFEFVNEDIKSIPAGSRNLIATHWLNGELPPLAKNAKAVFFNLTAAHDRRHIIHAVMESVCYTHRRYLDIYEKANHKKPKSIRVVGGGAVSDLWMQMLADILGISVEVPESPRYTGAMGAYYCAMVGLKRIDDYNAIYDTVRIEKEFTPNSANAEIYKKLYDIYLDLYPALKNVYIAINGEY